MNEVEFTVTCNLKALLSTLHRELVKSLVNEKRCSSVSRASRLLVIKKLLVLAEFVKGL